jgi:hypothetical protein
LPYAVSGFKRMERAAARDRKNKGDFIMVYFES